MDASTPNILDTGTAYGKKSGSYDRYLTEVGPGTPCGEFMRRYWQPVALSSDVTDRPVEIRILCEDLILFRDKKGRPGLLYPRCCHRGTSLYYGKCEDEGIRCCYHGWVFSVDGTCVEQPCEPPESTHKNKIRQPWYPVQEQYGLIWAYMGPPEKKPLLQKYDIFEDLEDGEYLEANDIGRSTGGLGKRFISPCNWLQHYENVVDPAHVQILHVKFTDFQFTDNIPIKNGWTFHYKDDGVQQISVGEMADGRRIERVFQCRFPNEKRTANPMMKPGRMDNVGFSVPVDDTHFLVLAVQRHSKTGKVYAQLKMGGKSWPELTPAERRDLPSDYEAQTGQGPIALHSEEHLATSDQGIVMLRRALRKQIDITMAGGDPAGVIYDPAQQIVKVEGGNIFSDPA